MQHGKREFAPRHEPIGTDPANAIQIDDGGEMQQIKLNLDQIDYSQLNYEREIGEWISTKVREEFIKQYRLKMNQEIKFTKGYDLYVHRLEDWKQATPEMRAKYEEMKKNAQVEEYKFMERVLQQFDSLARENEFKKMILEIQANTLTRLSCKGHSLAKVRELISVAKQRMLSTYLEKQNLKMKQYDQKLLKIVERQKLIDYFRQMNNKDFYERYDKRLNQVVAHVDVLKGQIQLTEQELIDMKNQLKAMQPYLKQDQAMQLKHEKINEMAQVTKEKYDVLKGLERILQQNKTECMKEIFEAWHKCKFRYSEQLYEMEIFLKKVLDANQSRQSAEQVGSKRQLPPSEDLVLLKRQRTAEHYEDKNDSAIASTFNDTTVASHRVEPVDRRTQAQKQQEHQHR